MTRIVPSPRALFGWSALAALSILAACSGAGGALTSTDGDAGGAPNGDGTPHEDAGSASSTSDSDAGAIGANDAASSSNADAASDGAAAAAPYPTSLSAATTTATTNAACTAITPFYWEIGNATSALASGSATGAAQTAITATDKMPIASASKWLYSSYWVERTKGVLSASDIQFFNFQSGYNSFTSCSGTLTVGTCAAKGDNGVLTPSTVGKFDYGGGHMQMHATQNGLANLTPATLADEIRSQLGTDIAIAYNSPQLAGGADMSADEYAKLLRKIIGGQLRMKDALGTHAVCTNPQTCPLAISTPSPKGEDWHYSIGHWVEDDPTVGDGAFSSPGAFGFYPWVDATKSFYGIVARHDLAGALDSVRCGRLIRKAWATGQPQ